MALFDLYDGLDSYYKIHYKLYDRFKIHNTSLNTWHIPYLFLTAIAVFLKLLKITSASSWFVVVISFWIYLVFLMLIIAGVFLHQRRQAPHPLKSCIYLDLANNFFGCLAVAGNLAALCFLMDNNGEKVVVYALFTPISFWFLVLASTSFAIRRYFNIVWYLIQIVLLNSFAVLLALKLEGKWDNKAFSWFIVLLPLLMCQIVNLLDKAITHYRNKWRLQNQESPEVVVELLSQKMDLSLHLAMQVPVILLYMFLGFLLDRKTEFTLTILMIIFIPAIVNLMIMFVWLMIKPRMMRFLVTNMGEEYDDFDAPTQPETYNELVNSLYHMIQERRERGELVDSQEIRFIEFLYQMQLQNRNLPGDNGVSAEFLSGLAVHEFDSATESVGLCTICISDFEHGQKLRELPCHHQFHQECIDVWLGKNKTCPNCQINVDQPQETPYYSDSHTQVDGL